MYETVKVVKGYAIERMQGMKGPFYVTLRQFERGREFLVFKTIKAATAYINDEL